MSVFEEQKEENSSPGQEENTEVKTADLEDGEIIEKDTKIEEEKKERLFKAHFNPKITSIIVIVNIPGPELI